MSFAHKIINLPLDLITFIHYYTNKKLCGKIYSQDCIFLLKYGVICTLQSEFTFDVQFGLDVRIQPVKPASCLCIPIHFTVLSMLFVYAKLCETYYKENVLIN